MTRSELKIWDGIRSRQVADSKFRRQAPIGPFFVDFYCPELRLIIEIDGPLHEGCQVNDVARDWWLVDHGYQVLRFTADAAYRHPEVVVQAIATEVARLREDPGQRVPARRSRS